MALEPKREIGGAKDNGLLALLRPKPTGRLLLSFDKTMDIGSRIEIVSRAAGYSVSALGLPSDQEMLVEPSQSSNSALLARFGIAVVPERDNRIGGSMMENLAAEDGVRFVRPEFYLFATDQIIDDPVRTWGVATTGAFESAYTGKGIKLAVLDTGLDLDHPDFKDRRSIVSRSFVDGETVDDVKGHGTHCAGTAAGMPSSLGNFRYGVAPDAELFIAKVLNDKGAGREVDIIAGMLWAIEQGCAVISMSLGRAVRQGEIVTPIYEEVAQSALDQGCLVVAAAGNNSTRQYGFVAPVSEPASAPSILSIAALDVDLEVAYFSNGSVNPKGGSVDIAAPGVSVISSVPGPKLYDTYAGTSMACPHVAGIAALWAESDSSLRGRALWKKIVETALPLAADPSDVGAGLVQAPLEVAARVA